jgi:hypothetical protein
MTTAEPKDDKGQNKEEDAPKPKQPTRGIYASEEADEGGAGGLLNDDPSKPGSTRR